MNTSDLQKLATHARSMREAGITLLFASGILSFFLLVARARTASIRSGYNRTFHRAKRIRSRSA